MPSFDIVKTNKITQSYRVARVMSEFDVKAEHANEHFKGEFELPEKWNIGVIVGNSGTGKSTISKQLFGENIYSHLKHSESAVIDDMPQDKSTDDIIKMFYSVGFGSVPCWLKPYSVLSTGEKMRVDLADALLRNDFVVFDEFTSVVDRNVAQTICIALHKTIKRNNQKFIAVTCHYDVIDYLQPDWVFDTSTMTVNFTQAHALKSNLSFESVSKKSGQNLGVITI